MMVIRGREKEYTTANYFDLVSILNTNNPNPDFRSWFAIARLIASSHGFSSIASFVDYLGCCEICNE